ncbi:RhuM family protein [Eubacterium xylanophilum]|uniref:RhuM family protein n=1 Tax=Eubacterium xylanophilum TaxID=39497 RepID=UPI0004BA8052|nr:RhuM family protein [Eubacterium xylanophilum]
MVGSLAENGRYTNLDETSVGFSDKSSGGRKPKSVGYRVNSKRGIAFRRWANSVLRKYIIDGCTSYEYPRVVKSLAQTELGVDELNCNNIFAHCTFSFLCLLKPTEILGKCLFLAWVL